MLPPASQLVVALRLVSRASVVKVLALVVRTELHAQVRMPIPLLTPSPVVLVVRTELQVLTVILSVRLLPSPAVLVVRTELHAQTPALPPVPESVVTSRMLNAMALWGRYAGGWDQARESRDRKARLARAVETRASRESKAGGFQSCPRILGMPRQQET